MPNILWLMCDQMRADALGIVSPWMHTPNLDKLAAQGVRLANLFAQSPVCVPSRCNFVTGRYPHAHRVRENHTRLASGEPHLFRLCKAAGYRTGLVGKNHMFEERDMLPLDFDFSHLHNETTGVWGEHLTRLKHDFNEKGSWAGARFNDLPEEGSSTHRIGTRACSVLEEMARAADESPFLLWVSFHDPHAPHTVPRRLADLYPPDSLPLPPNALGPTADTELPGKPARQAIKRDAQKMPDASEAALRNYIAVYSAMVSYVDEWMGRILETLERTGQAENTIVVFVSDHGDFRGEHGMVKKDLVLYDALLHIPGIVRFPGHLPAGRVAEALCEQVDLYPTLAEMLGQTLPRGVQGTSLLPLLRGETEQHKETVYAEVCPPYFANPYPNYAAFIAEWERAQSIEGHPLRWTANFNIPGDHVKALRTADWKYIWYKNGEEELYDLRSDAKETRNLAADSLHAATKAELRHCLFAWVVETEDPRDPKDDQRITDSLPWGEPTLLPGKRPSAG